MKVFQINKALASAPENVNDYELCYRNKYGEVLPFRGNITISIPNRVLIIEVTND